VCDGWLDGQGDAEHRQKGRGGGSAGRDSGGGATNFPRPITLHECRHTFASLLIDAGANPKAIQQFMGTPRFRPPSTSTGICCPVATMRSANGWTDICEAKADDPPATNR
jgi:hypothetical protein